MSFAALLLTAILHASANQTPLRSTDMADTANLRDVIASTTMEWHDAFAANGSVYVAPRVVFLRPPPGHPARGAGYSRSVGLVIDLGDIDAILTAFPNDGPSLVALMMAHEVGHHVQHLMGDDPEVTGIAREHQADCLAGWWISRANNRAGTAGTLSRWPLLDLSTRLPETLRLLDTLQSGSSDGGEINLDTHGPVDARVAAFEKGMATSKPWTCLWGNNP